VGCPGAASGERADASWGPLADLLASLKLEEQNVMKILHSQSAEDD
jgi:hypothetical protein